MTLVITCEHAGNTIPDEFNQLFSNKDEILDSHQGWDPGAWDMACFLSGELDVPAVGCFTTRLLIEANRSLDNAGLFSSVSAILSEDKKNKLINTIYLPYRNKAEDLIKGAGRPVLHLSVHSFTPVWNNVPRNMEIGLLFDPERKSEKQFCIRFQELLKNRFPDFNILFNEPYQGIDDGFTTHLRTRYPDEDYLGIELELNQKLFGTPDWQVLKEGLTASLKELLAP